MKINPEIISKGLFLEELKPRFRCIVLVNGEETPCYIPASCKLSNFLNLQKQEVLLVKNKTGKELHYSVFAVNHKGHYIILDLALANKFIFQEIHRRRFSFLGKRSCVLSEVKFSNYRADIFIPSSNTVIEVKSVISLSKETEYPLSDSLRMITQLKQIKELLHLGYSVYYFFIAFSPKTRIVHIRRSSQFYSVFMECLSLGLHCFGWRVSLQKDEIKITSKLTIEYAEKNT